MSERTLRKGVLLGAAGSLAVGLSILLRNVRVAGVVRVWSELPPSELYGRLGIRCLGGKATSELYGRLDLLVRHAPLLHWFFGGTAPELKVRVFGVSQQGQACVPSVDSAKMRVYPLWLEDSPVEESIMVAKVAVKKSGLFYQDLGSQLVSAGLATVDSMSLDFVDEAHVPSMHSYLQRLEKKQRRAKLFRKGMWKNHPIQSMAMGVWSKIDRWLGRR